MPRSFLIRSTTPARPRSGWCVLVEALVAAIVAVAVLTWHPETARPKRVSLWTQDGRYYAYPAHPGVPRQLARFGVLSRKGY